MRNFYQNYYLKEHFLSLIPDSLMGNYAEINLNRRNTFIKKLISNSNTLSILNLHNTSKNTIIVERVLNYKLKNMSYRHTRNHAIILKLLNKLVKRSNGSEILNVPKIISYIETNNRLTTTREFIEGDVIRDKSQKDMKKALILSITGLRLYSENLTKSEILQLPTRGKIYTIVFFPLYCFKLFFKDPLFVLKSFYFIKLFYKCYLATPKVNNLIISHRDLSPNNILLAKNKVFLIDFETTLLSEPETDIAIASMYFSKIMKTDLMMCLKEFIETNSQRNDFIRLSVFYIFQLLSNESINTKYYKDTIEHSLFLRKKIIPELNSWQLSH